MSTFRLMLGTAAIVMASAGGAYAAPASSPGASFRPGPANSVVGYLMVEKTPFATLPNAEDVKRAQACKDQVVQKDAALAAPAAAKEASAQINACLGADSRVFTLPWLGSTPINTYLN